MHGAGTKANANPDMKQTASTQRLTTKHYTCTNTCYLQSMANEMGISEENLCTKSQVLSTMDVPEDVYGTEYGGLRRMALVTKRTMLPSWQPTTNSHTAQACPGGRPQLNTGAPFTSNAGHYGPQRALMIMIICMCVLWECDARRGLRRSLHQVAGPRAPETLTQAKGTYVTKYSYERIRSTHIDTNIVRPQPAPAKAAHGLTIITMNVTSCSITTS